MSKKKLENIDYFLQYDINIKERVLWIRNDIDIETMTTTIKNLQLIMADESTKPIRIFIQTYGGDIYSAFGLYDFINSLPVTVMTIANGPCMSAGTVIWCAGDQRFVTPNTVLMFHNVSSEVEGKQPDISKEAEECEKLFSGICKIYEDKSNKKYAYWYKAIKHVDKYVRSKEAITLGMAHEII